MALYKRSDGRLHNQIRDVKIMPNAFGYAPGSMLFQLGNTKVLCSVTMQNMVPHFLKGGKTGWLTAEYAMLPTATEQRTQRASSLMKQQGRAVEISRLIGRVLRSIVDLDSLGERTILVDCDVLQADGGTRAASITGASIALQQAEQAWLASGIIKKSFLKDTIAAVSVGMLKGESLLDLNFIEDSSIDSDFNFVLSRSGHIVEIQGTAERSLLSWKDFDLLRSLAVKGIDQLFGLIDEEFVIPKEKEESKQKVPLFSLQNRLSHEHL